MQLNTTKINLSDEDIKNAILIVCDELSNKIQNPETIHLYAIPRGGMVLAQYVAYYFGIPKTNIHLCLEPDDIIEHHNDVYVCDDIFDSGKTLEKFKDFTCVTLFGRKTRGWKDNVFAGVQIEHDKYVNFPWDFESQLKSNESVCADCGEVFTKSDKTYGLYLCENCNH